jgi:two-component sensor histidine kinase
MITRFSFLNYLCFLPLLLSINTSIIYGQISDDTKFDFHYSNSIELNKLSNYSESIKELEKAIAIAHKNNWEKKYLDTSITLGEMMRRTADQKKGLEILYKLTRTKKYIKLHVRKLGRIAALYAESQKKITDFPSDSIKKYLGIALKLAKENRFYAEEASLCNELGFFKMQNENLEEAKPLLLRSANLFKEVKDDNNYVVVMCHLLAIAVREEKIREADLMIKELLDIVKNNNWYGVQQTLYKNIASRYLKMNDSISYYKWMLKEKDAGHKVLEQRNNQKMSDYRVAYDTEKFKVQATESEKKSKEQRRNNNILLVFTSISLVLMIVIAKLFVKKKKMAKSLEISNEKFQMLMVESNHRIKNNLQMILSMVDYSTDKATKSETHALNKISGKIQTISVLHKHLYIDVHNEHVSIGIYFEEIIRLYSIMNPNSLHIIKNIYPVKINSERIVYFGLILNELLANTIEHNLSEIKIVSISIKLMPNHFIFEYNDNSPHEESLVEGKGSILLNQLIKRVKGVNYHLDKKAGNHKFEFKDVV